MLARRIPSARLGSILKRFTHASAKESSTAPGKVHFGYQTVDEDIKEDMVKKVFQNVAEKYDLMNDLMSGGAHRLWKHHFMSKLGPGEDTKLLDVAGGTGDIAFRFLDHVRKEAKFGTRYSAHVTVYDINNDMLRVGQERASKSGYGDPSEISWECGNAESLPFDDNSFDAYTIAFGIRNCTHVDRVLSEAHRVLKPGGRFMCLEFSRVENAMVSSVYDAFSFNIIPALGHAIANDRASYQYLVESIRKFPSQPAFAEMIRTAGFDNVSWENLTFGVAAIHSGWKP